MTLESETFTVPPGEEVYKCQTFANPFAGQQVDVRLWEANMTEGSHHMFMFYVPDATDEPLDDCSGFEIKPFTFVAQGPHVFQTYPEGIGAAIPASIGLKMNVHYVNVGTDPYDAKVKVTMHLAKPGVITQHAGIIFNSNIFLSEPADGVEHTFTKTCSIGQDATILMSNSHMHRTATRFISTINETTLYETTAWADPPMQPPPGGPLAVSASDSFTWSCTYAPTDVPLKFGETTSDIMCITQAVYVPVLDVENPFLGCKF